jgi:PEP-CTERM motif
MRRSWLCTLLLALALLPGAARAISISLVASPTVVPAGGVVTFDIIVDGLAGSEFVSAYDLAIQFDPSQFGLVTDSFAVGTALGSVFDVEYFDFTDFSGAAGGELLPYVVSLLDDAALATLQPGPTVTLGSFALLARRGATDAAATIGLGCNSAAGPLDGNDLAVLLEIESCSGTTVAIETITAPEPGTLALLAFGLLALVWVGQQRPGTGQRKH